MSLVTQENNLVTTMMLQGLMKDYLNESYPMKSLNQQPIKVKESNWIVADDRIKIVYDFETDKQKEAFCVEILKYLRTKEADIELRLRANKVAIIIYAYSTHISSLELEASKDIEKIKKDTVYYYAKKE